MGWFESLAASGSPPTGLAEWARAQPDRAAAWRTCPNASWQLWLAAHAPNLSHDDQRTVIRAALATTSDGSASFLDFLRPWVTTKDALAAWSRRPEVRLDSRQKLIAGNHAFMLALIAVIIVDRTFGAAVGTGTVRSLTQAAAVLIGWGILAVPFSMLRRSALDRAVARRSFSGAVEEATSLLQAREAGAAPDPAASLREHLRFLATAHFG